MYASGRKALDLFHLVNSTYPQETDPTRTLAELKPRWRANLECAPGQGSNQTHEHCKPSIPLKCTKCAALGQAPCHTCLEIVGPARVAELVVLVWDTVADAYRHTMILNQTHKTQAYITLLYSKYAAPPLQAPPPVWPALPGCTMDPQVMTCWEKTE
jgi:hypothetical protein